MPKRTDLKKIAVIGAGPIIIGQACEFDYSGTQACKALREEGYEVILVNSNPATIMTDPETADRTYIEPITPEAVEKIIAADRRMQERLPPVLIEGETGTGKTSIARWLHQQGPRARQTLAEVNCPAVPESLAESELFGHERGAFTDARGARMGLFEAANGGSLFLDELPSLSLAVQAKILKAIEDQRIRRLGATREMSVDVRVIAATHRDLAALVQA